MRDPTEQARRAMLAETAPDYTGPTWDTRALQEAYYVIGFCAPFVVVTRKADGVRGSLRFTHSPRVYFDFKEG